MNDTSTDPHQQQMLPPPHQDLDRLRRSVSDRYVAGVAGGLGRHFNLDPTVVRVLLAVLTLFGGAGVLIYGVCWAFVPEDGKERASINIGSDARKILLLAAAGIAFLLAMGDAFSGFNAGWPIASVAVVIGVIMVARDRRNDRSNDRSNDRRAAPYAGSTATGLTSESTTSTDTAVLDAPVADAMDAPPPAWKPPVVTPPLLPSHPKRTGILWFLPTVALIAIGLGTVGIVDSGHHVAAGVYPAVALAITGVMLLVGSFYGRPGGLIFLGFVSTFVLSVATVLGTFNFDGRNLDADPTTSAEVQSTYSVHMGRVHLDLTDVVDPQNLAGKEIKLHLNAGEITVIVPKNVNLEIDAEMGFAGGIDIPGYDGGGIEDKAERSISAIPANNSAPLVLDIDVRVGQINVEHR